MASTDVAGDVARVRQEEALYYPNAVSSATA